jgi:S1-C subfamily serine protease
MIRLTALLILFGMLVVPVAEAQSILEQIEREVAAIVRQTRPGVVTIVDVREGKTGGAEGVRSGAEEGKPLRSSKGEYLEKASAAKESAPSKPASPPAKIGSGFVIQPEFVVTTADVLEGMERPTVVTDSGARYRAFVVQIDHELNIGMLRLPASAKVEPLKVGTSSGVQSGQFAIAIGNQVGQPNAAAITLVSGLRKEGSFAGRRFYPSLIQLAGSLGAGSSGAPLVNSRAEVIGMVVAVAPPAAEQKTAGQGPGGYALPIDDVRATTRLMANVKQYLRSWLGADLREEARVENRPDGSMVVTRTVWVEAVHPNSPAMAAGFLKGDQLLSLNGAQIKRMAEVRAAVVRLMPEEKLNFVVRRGGRDVKAPVAFALRPPGGGKL